jgi:hypothetical protein
MRDDKFEGAIPDRASPASLRASARSALVVLRRARPELGRSRGSVKRLKRGARVCHLEDAMRQGV